MLNGIKGRWIRSYLLLVVIILIIFEVIFSFTIKNYYYSGVEQSIVSKANITSNFLNKYHQPYASSFFLDSRKIIEEFSFEESLELQLIDVAGRIRYSSSGFGDSELVKSEDFYSALLGGTHRWIGYDSRTGEKIMSVSTPLFSWNKQTNGVLRYVTSLEGTDEAVRKIVLISIAFSGTVIIFVAFSGIYFIKTLINPIKDINSTARRIAKGDFSARNQTRVDDEIGELSDSINFMAKELAKIDSLKNEFISSISHELRTPLTSIKGWAETIDSGHGYDERETRKGLGIIMKEATRLSGMLEELLDFSKMESGKLSIQKEEVEILDEFEEVLFLFKERAKRDGIEIDYEEADDIPKIYGDKDRLRQVFVNIMDNAIKFSEEKGRIFTKIWADEYNVFIEVEDLGCGICKEDLIKVKEKFFKGKSQKKGSGIGLAICDEIVELHGGKLEINSKPGNGTKIRISLPINK